MSNTTETVRAPVVHLQYRPDINGLRAVAVLSVLLFHAFPTLLPGGFVGVDIFFVISGFLISNIIFQNLANGSFSFVDFYARRVRRIFPALLLVLTCCLLGGWFTLLAHEYAQLGKHIAAGAGFVSNLALWQESGYFDTDSNAKPLLHLWSLGIEEQFYLLWPLLLWLAWKKRYSLLAVTLVILMLSFGINLSDVGQDTAAAYYSPLGRFWELLVGALLALRLSTARSAASHLPRPDWCAAVGAVLIALSITMIDKHASFPGWWALLPVMGTALLIGAGDAAWLNRKLLSNRVLLGVGLISYPLYLWHWPLLSFAEIIAAKVPAPQYRVLCLLMAVVLAWLTYLVIERPYRARSFRMRQLVILGASMAVLGLLGFNILHREGLPFRHEQLSSAKPAGARSFGFTALGVAIRKDTKVDFCHQTVPRSGNELDTFCHQSGAQPYLAVIGDSHANHLFYGLKSSGDKRLNQVLVVGAGGCQPALQGGQSDNCDKQSTVNLAVIQHFDSIKVVAFSASSSWIQTRSSAQVDVLLKGYLDTIQRLQNLGKKVVLIVDTPGFQESPFGCASNPLAVRNQFKDANAVCEKLSLERTLPRDVYQQFVQALKNKTSAVQFIDAYAQFCDQSHCQVIDDDTLLFMDSNHLTDYGSKLVAERIEAELP